MTERMRRGAWIVLLGLPTVVIEPALGQAREPPVGTGHLVGRVSEAGSGQAVGGASVALTATTGRSQSLMTNVDGRFSARDLSAGEYVARIEHLGYVPVSVRFRIEAGTTTPLSVLVVADPLEMDPLLVRVRRNDRLSLRGFHERRELGEALGEGEFFDAEEIRRWSETALSAFLRHAMRKVGCSVYINGVLRPAPRIETIVSPGRPPQVQHVPIGIALDELVTIDMIDGIEIYANGVPGFAGQFSDPRSLRCGATVIWTR